MNQKRIGSIIAISSLLLVSCGQTVLPEANPQDVLKSARAEFVKQMQKEIDEKNEGSTTTTLTIDGAIPQGSIKATGTVNGLFEPGTEDQFNSSTKLDLAVDLDTMMAKGNAQINLEFKMLNEVLYMYLTTLDVSTENEELSTMISQYMPIVDLYSKKWFKLDLAALAAQTGGEQLAFNSMSPETAKQMIALLNSHQIFNVEKELPAENGMYVYQVTPSYEGIKALLDEVLALASSPVDFTEEDDAELQNFIALLSDKNVTHTLYIDGTTKKYRKFISEGKVATDSVEGNISSTIDIPNEKNMTWNASATLVKGGDELKASLAMTKKNDTGKVNFSIEVPAEEVKLSVDADSIYKKEDVTIDEPTDAADLAQMLGMFGLGTSMDESTMMEGDDTMMMEDGSMEMEATDDAAMMDGEESTMMEEDVTKNLIEGEKAANLE